MKKFKWLIVDALVIAFVVGIAVVFVALGKWDWKWCSIFFLITYFFNTVFVVFSLSNNDNAREKMSWIFFMVCIPFIGLVFYSLFRVRRIKGMSYEEFEKEFDEFRINNYSEQFKDEKNIYQWQEKLVKRNFHPTKIKVYQHGYEAYEQILEDIQNAKKYIHIEMYILKDSEIYERLKKILFEKVNKGVEVRIIFDKFGSWKVPIDEFKYLKKKGIKLCFFNIPIYPYVRQTDNRRLHRKFFIIDGQKIHIGGLNITDEYCSYSKKYGYWADSNFLMEGKVINDYESIFLYDWFKITKERLNKSNYLSNQSFANNNSLVLSFEDGPHLRTNYLEDSIDQWINNASKKISIATPYFIPSEKNFNSLINALSRGVEIELFIPGKPDKKLTYNGTLYYANELIKRGAKVYSFRETFIHAKIGIFDNDFAYLGTNNLDMRSLFTNKESINLVISKEVNYELERVLETYKELSDKLEYKKQSKFTYNINQFIFKLLSPLM